MKQRWRSHDRAGLRARVHEAALEVLLPHAILRPTRLQGPHPNNPKIYKGLGGSLGGRTWGTWMDLVGTWGNLGGGTWGIVYTYLFNRWLNVFNTQA